MDTGPHLQSRLASYMCVLLIVFISTFGTLALSERAAVASIDKDSLPKVVESNRDRESAIIDAMSQLEFYEIYEDGITHQEGPSEIIGPAGTSFVDRDSDCNLGGDYADYCVKDTFALESAEWSVERYWIMYGGVEWAAEGFSEITAEMSDPGIADRLSSADWNGRYRGFYAEIDGATNIIVWVGTVLIVVKVDTAFSPFVVVGVDDTPIQIAARLMDSSIDTLEQIVEQLTTDATTD